MGEREYSAQCGKGITAPYAIVARQITGVKRIPFVFTNLFGYDQIVFTVDMSCVPQVF